MWQEQSAARRCPLLGVSLYGVGLYFYTAVGLAAPCWRNRASRLQKTIQGWQVIVRPWGASWGFSGGLPFLFSVEMIAAEGVQSTASALYDPSSIRYSPTCEEL